MIITDQEELVDGARFFVDFDSSVKIVYHAAAVDAVFTDAPLITRADGLISFDSESGTTKERCSIQQYDDGKQDKINFISVETVKE